MRFKKPDRLGQCHIPDAISFLEDFMMGIGEADGPGQGILGHEHRMSGDVNDPIEPRLKNQDGSGHPGRGFGDLVGGRKGR